MPPAPSTRPSLKISYSFSYRGSATVVSNRYHLSGGTPANDSAWAALALAVRNDFKALVTSGFTIVGSHGYAAGSEVPVWSEVVSVAGTKTGATPLPGECAFLLRWTTDQRTSKNHPIYLFNYCHGAEWSGSGSTDTLSSAQKTAAQTYAAKWASGGAGFSDGSLTYHRCGPYGAVGLVGTCDAFVRHRDFV